ncbi:MAG: hypothetical protein R3Y26_09005 [Rikenellaceae bacterium]
MIKKLLFAMITFVAVACSTSPEKSNLDVYIWCGSGPGTTEEALDAQMAGYKARGLKGIFYNVSFDNLELIEKASRIAKKNGLEFHTWIPTLLQSKRDEIQEDWYIVSREGYNAYEKPAFVDYYKFLCPNRDEVYEYLSAKYQAVADIKDVDGIHLDYIRFPDVYLAPGLWEKYGLEMTEEFAPFDYCYCDKCVADFEAIYGFDIRELGDSAQTNLEWRQFRQDVVTKLVNKLVEDVHSHDKEISAAVFPGPSLSKKMVRQEWDKWNLDITIPMLYNDFYLEDTNWIGEMTKEGVEATEGKSKFISGIFVCSKPEKKNVEKDPEGHGLLVEDLKPAIDNAMDNGAKAICIFGTMTPEHWDELARIKAEYNKK